MKIEAPIVGYANLLKEVKNRIAHAQYDALKTVNRALVGLYWDIGHLIIERQQGESWGRAVVQQLAEDLRATFPGMQGFSAANLWRIRSFYETYRQNEKLAPLVREIGWTQNVIVMERCKDDLQREFYLKMIRKCGWTKNVLLHQIESQLKCSH